MEILKKKFKFHQGALPLYVAIRIKRRQKNVSMPKTKIVFKNKTLPIIGIQMMRRHVLPF